MKFFFLLILVSLLQGIFGLGTNCGEDVFHLLKKNSVHIHSTETPVNYRVVFIGDQGLGDNPRRVLTDIKNWEASMVIHSGDYDYVDSPSSFISLVDSVLGPDFPYFASIGNHDTKAWDGNSGYKVLLENKLKHIKGANCWGEYGVNMACSYQGLLFVLSGVGTKGKDHVQFIDETFSQHASIWKICSWHKNQHLFQTGGKTDETGYGVYDICRSHGALIATGHEHSYSRTYLMSSFAKQEIAPEKDKLILQQGKTVAFVSGLAGKNIRPWRNNLEKNPWWEKCAASDNGVNYGALYCTFNRNGISNVAECFFKDISGKEWDRFTLNSSLSSVIPTFNDMKCNSPFSEYAIQSSEDEEIIAPSHLLDSQKKELLLSHPSVEASIISRFTFHNVSLEKGKQNLVYLQLLGSEFAKGKAEFVIFVELKGLGKSFLPIIWNKVEGEENGWERESGWSSPNLSFQIEDILSSNDESSWTGSVTVELRGKGATRTIFSYNYSPCLAPALIVQKYSNCSPSN